MTRLCPENGKPYRNMEQRDALIKLGAERLADELLMLAEGSGFVDDRVNFITSSASENLERFQQQLEALCNGDFYDWRTVSQYAEQLSRLLENLRESVESPCEGIKWVSLFFQKDRVIMESCDDSGGDVGMVFLVDATECFAHFARQCADPDYVAESLLGLVLENEYGVRDELIKIASAVLPEPWLRWMVQRLMDRKAVAEDAWEGTSYDVLLRSLAKQLNDAGLFQTVAIVSGLSFGLCLEIAEIYLDNRSLERAQSWVDRANEEFTDSYGYHSNDVRRIQQEIYHQQGNRSGEVKIAWEIFRANRSVEAMDMLLQTVGEELRSDVITKETEAILNSSTEQLVSKDVSFLLDLEDVDAVERYLMERAALLRSQHYTVLTNWVAHLEQCSLLASLIYRALLDDILDRGYTKAYHYGVDYWYKLQWLSPQVADWSPYLTHLQYQKQVQQQHGRKYSFWQQVSERGDR